MKKKIIIVVLWLLIWQLLALLIHNQILIAGPIETFKSLGTMIFTADFWGSVISTGLRIIYGLTLGTAAGILIAVLSYKVAIIKDFMSPFITVMKAIPVASFVIIVLIWMGNTNLSVIISMLVVFPIMYLNTLEGLYDVDKKLLEMADVYNMSLFNQIKYIFFPEMYYYLVSGFSLAVGLAWKSGVAAEVIGQPLGTIGNELYRAKIYLETADLFAWT
ncbi:MAG: ABC transporter permease subunit, partial [Butyrivibrio sp.]|nr:ABC transporter permease subunit [Butyrivibrio sp.]